MSENVKVETRGPILVVTLDRPKANAIDAATSRRMGEVFAGFRDDPDLRVAILTGGGERFFSAGWDLKAAAGGEFFDSDFGVGGFGGVSRLFDLQKPVIAAVNGYAAGGGFELALACDMIVAADHAQFFLPEAALGILADSGALRLPKRMPRAIALELLMTGRRMAADEAARWGIVNRVVPLDGLMEAAHELAEQIVAAAPLAIATLKEVVGATENLTIEEGYALLESGKLATYEKMLKSEDAQEGPRAFAEKRAPVWKGR